MICCECGEVLDFQYKPISLVFVEDSVVKIICKDCKKLKDKEKEEN